MHVMSPVQQASLKYGKDYILIEILHYIDFIRKKYDLNCCVICVNCGFILLWSACATLYYYNKNIFGKLNSFLYLCDLIKYIMKYSYG